MNFCGPIELKQCAKNTAICQVWDYNCPTVGCGSASWGSTLNQKFSFEYGNIVSTFDGGDDGRKTKIKFICKEG